MPRAFLPSFSLDYHVNLPTRLPICTNWLNVAVAVANVVLYVTSVLHPARICARLHTKARPCILENKRYTRLLLAKRSAIANLLGLRRVCCVAAMLCVLRARHHLKPLCTQAIIAVVTPHPSLSGRDAPCPGHLLRPEWTRRLPQRTIPPVLAPSRLGIRNDWQGQTASLPRSTCGMPSSSCTFSSAQVLVRPPRLLLSPHLLALLRFHYLQRSSGALFTFSILGPNPRASTIAAVLSLRAFSVVAWRARPIGLGFVRADPGAFGRQACRTR